MSSADAPPTAASAALSASTPAFRPSEDNRSSHSLGGTGAGGSSLWGAIGQSFSFASNNNNNNISATSASSGAGPSSLAAAAARGGNTSRYQTDASDGLDLWNFGGFDVDALTADKTKEDESSYGGGGGGYDARSRYRNESRLTSAFGNLEVSSMTRPPPGPYGGREDGYGGRDDYYRRQQGGWDGIPRWTPTSGGQVTYPGSMYQGYGAGTGHSNSRHIPPYPSPDMNEYGPPPPNYQHQSYQPQFNRNVPSFVPPPPAAHYGRNSTQVNVPAGPYPPSFPLGGTANQNIVTPPFESRNSDGYGDTTGTLDFSGGGGALASLLQTPYNPQLAAQQRKYPPILGGSPSPVPSDGLYSEASSKPPTGKSAGFRGADNPAIAKPFVPKGIVSAATSLTSVGTMMSGQTTPTDEVETPSQGNDPPILPKRTMPEPSSSPTSDDEYDTRATYNGLSVPAPHDSIAKKREWLLTMNQTLESTPVGELDPNSLPLSTIMNGWAKQKSSEGARMVEMWLERVHAEYNADNPYGVHPTARMYTMAVDAWAKSGGGAPAARRAEALLERMDRLYRDGGGRHEALKPTTGIFNAVINAWARSREKIAPARAEQILAWMEKLREQAGDDVDISPDKYTFNTVIHAYAKSGAKEAATKAHKILDTMNQMYREGNSSVKPDTITYNVVINAYAKSGGKGAAQEAEHLLQRMHMMYDQGDLSVKPNVVTYGAVIDAFAKSMDRNAAARADALLANMVGLHQSDPVRHADLRPNTYVFNTVINAWAKSKERGAAAKAEEMLVAMDRLHASGFPGLKPDAFTYTAVIDAYAKSGYRGAASRADLLLDQMEAKYTAGDNDLKPNTFTYNAVINALAKSGEPGAAARAERVLQKMVHRLRTNGGNEVKPTTINFNTVLDAWAKSGEGEAAAERAEAILEWMDRLNKAGNTDVKPDTITFNAVIDAWARSGSKRGPFRAEQILNHMDELYQGGNLDVKPDTYTYNTLINALAKSGDGGSAARAEEILAIMEQRFQSGDKSFKPNTRSHTSVIDAWAKSGEPGAARRAEQILENLKSLYESTGDPDIKPNVYTANAVMNACAFTKHEADRAEALDMAFRTFEWLDSQKDIKPDAYTFTIMLSVCANLIGKEDANLKFEHARNLFHNCCDSGHVNDHVLWKLKLTVSENEYVQLVGYGVETKAVDLPPAWSRALKGKSAGDNRNNNNWSRNRGKKNSM
ncbi:hypothetical protein ACHAW6_015211 [Cyclotella cf. meneghiniana]